MAVGLGVSDILISAQEFSPMGATIEAQADRSKPNHSAQLANLLPH